MKSHNFLGDIPSRRLLEGVAEGIMGLVLMLSLLKWGDAVILDDPAVGPGALLLSNGAATNQRYWLVAVAGAVGLLIARWRTGAPRWIAGLPLAWFGWQLVAATYTVDPGLTRATIKHFAACVTCFYIGLFSLGRIKNPWPVFSFLLIGLLVVLWTGFGQHYGGLEATRQFYQKLYRGEPLPDIQQQSELQQVRALYNQPDFQKRIASNRIFGTLMYPNALAGVIILILPVSLATVVTASGRLPFLVRGILVGLLGYGGLACLVWSGSKAGWLIGLIMALTALFHVRLRTRHRLVIIGAVLVIGLTGFFVNSAAYFKKGATSVSARVDYWLAGLHIAADRPLVGSGPGTFGVLYRTLKAPKSEMARLSHNDYLEQACDSGIFGFLCYSAFVFGLLAILYRKRKSDILSFCTWLALLGWAIQGFVEFGLYIPAIAWPAFFMSGWLLGRDSVRQGA